MSASGDQGEPPAEQTRSASEVGPDDEDGSRPDPAPGRHTDTGPQADADGLPAVDAGRTADPHGRRSGREARRRLLSGMRHASRRQLVGGLLVALLGFAMVTQLRARNDDDAYAGLRSADLIQVLNGLNAQSRRAETEVNQLQRTRSQLTDSTQRRQAATARAREEASTLGILAGTVAATGPGVRVTIEDPDDKLSLNNLLDAVEELRAAGAEAMEFNDSVRIVASTSFEQTADGLVVGGKQLSSPYVIDAIGNPDTLAPVLGIAEGFGFDVGQAGGSVAVQKLEQVKITALVDPADDRFANPSG